MADEVQEQSAPPLESKADAPKTDLRIVAPIRPEGGGTGIADIDVTEPGDSSHVLLDMAIKRLEMQDKLYDSLTTRTGLVLGFTTFLIPKCAEALKALPYLSLRQIIFAGLFGASYIAMVGACFIGMKVQRLDTYPDVVRMALNGEHQKKEREVKHLLFQEIAKAYGRNVPLLKRKARTLNAALYALLALMGLLVAGFGAGAF